MLEARTQAQVFFLQKKIFKFFFVDLQKNGLQKIFSGDLPEKRSPNKFFRRSPKKTKGLRKFSARFLAFSNKIFTAQKIVLSSSRGQGNFRGLEASRSRTSKCVLEDSNFVTKYIFSDYRQNYSVSFVQKSKHAIQCKPNLWHNRKLRL